MFIQENAFENVVCEMASICLGLNVLIHCPLRDLNEILNTFQTNLVTDG